MSEFQPWEVLHLDLDESLPQLRLAPGRGGIFAVLWSGGVPLGHLELPADWLPLAERAVGRLASQAVTPAVGHHLFARGFEAPFRDLPPEVQAGEGAALGDLLNCSKPLAVLRERLRARRDHAEAGPVSVIVCTRNRPQDLGRCLHSLQQSSQQPDEILVVDNAPDTPETRRIVERFPGVRYLPEPRPGLSAARNAGVRQARGEIIAFTDDDVEVHPDWLAHLSRAFVTPDTLAVTGLVLPAELETEAQWLFEKHFGGFSQGYRERVFDSRFFERTRTWGTPVWSIGAGANMAFRRRAFAEVGLFDERLGAGAAGCSEDSELWYRLLARGWICRYDPAPVVFHYHRREMAALSSQMYHYMRGHAAALLVQSAQHPRRGNYARLFLITPLKYLQRIVYGYLQGPKSLHVNLGAEVRGCAAGVHYYLRHRRSRPAGSASVTAPSTLERDAVPS